MKSVYIVSGDSQYEALFYRLGFSIENSKARADLICFTGGEDVSPSVYGDIAHRYTHSNIDRDQREARIMQDAVKYGIPMVGICRGAQFLNVMSGGRMYQHVSEHTRSHHITDARTGDTVYVSSTHHQMMMPSPEAILVASSALGGEREWYDGDVFLKDVSAQDIEVVYYENTRALCFQPHPEFHSAEYAGMELYFSKLLSEFFNL